MKKLILAVVFALLAVSCGGSDDSATDTDTSSPTATASDADAAGDSSDSNSSDRADEDEADLPDLLTSTPLQERDCAHSVVELGGADGETEQAVELPPQVKPEVDDEYLGDVDELIVTDLIVGTGREAVSGAEVEMEYVGVLGADGTEFDSSWDPEDAPFSFALDTGRVIPGWDEGIQGMKVGGRRVLQIPAAQAYGDQARGEIITANSDLVFIVDLIAVSPPPEPAPPVDDEYLGSFGELQIIDLVEGEGCEAQPGDIVTVDYVGVDAVAGEEFDSSWSRGLPFDVIVEKGQVIDGWREGIAGMRVGGERILQIPADKAYGEGDLVFRIHMDALIEAPVAHTVSFDGDVPDDLEVTTLTEGEGDEAAPGSIVDAHIVVMLHNSGTIVQSTYQDGSPTQLALQEGALLPGLEEGIAGTKVGEIRQVILPPSVAYPDGEVPPNGIDADDAFVFIIEPLRITNN